MSSSSQALRRTGAGRPGANQPAPIPSLPARTSWVRGVVRPRRGEPARGRDGEGRGMGSRRRRPVPRPLGLGGIQRPPQAAAGARGRRGAFAATTPCSGSPIRRAPSGRHEIAGFPTSKAWRRVARRSVGRGAESTLSAPSAVGRPGALQPRGGTTNSSSSCSESSPSGSAPAAVRPPWREPAASSTGDEPRASHRRDRIEPCRNVPIAVRR